MDKYLIRKPRTQDSSPMQDSSPSSKQNLGLRQKISSYHPNNHDEIRRHYLGKGPCRPPHDYPVSYFSGKPRRFRVKWYVTRNWLEYSIAKDAAFCFYCYLFEKDVGKQGGGDTFLDSHVGGVNSAHNQAVKKSEDLQKEKQHIQSVLVKQSNQDKVEYRIQLNAIVDCLLQFLGDHNESINEVMQNTWKNCKLTHHDIQKDMDLDNGFFSILVDESRDISVKEQMALVLRYVNKQGIIIERLSRLRGQGYDGASNMQGDINAFYVHCFAHQLQLTLVAVAKNHINIADFFYVVSNLVTVVGGSYLENGVRRSGQGLNQETNLKCPGDTRRGSYYGTILNLILMFSAVAYVLEIIEEDGLFDQKVEARSIMSLILSFEFVFALHLMKNILGITNELSIALQKKKNQDIVNAIDLVKVSKQRWQVMRDDEWISLLTEVSSFCATHDIPILNMDEIFVVSGRPQRNTQQNTNLYHYRVELFYTVIDMQLQELNNRFQSNSFVAFNKEKLIHLAKFYPYDFPGIDILALDSQLQNFIFDMRNNDLFLELQGVSELAEKLVSTKKHKAYPLVYLLVKLTLTLLVATATVERSFSAMKYIKNKLRNQIRDQWMNDCLVVYIEKDVACSIDNETIMQRFQKMKNRRRQL
ncbi:hypothetical protein ACJW31_05G032600 [Castanea mollissima]